MVLRDGLLGVSTTSSTGLRAASLAGDRRSTGELTSLKVSGDHCGDDREHSSDLRPGVVSGNRFK